MKMPMMGLAVWATIAFGQPALEFSVDTSVTRDGTTIIKLVDVPGAKFQAWAGKQLVFENTVPTSFKAQPGVEYRVVITLPNGQTWSNMLSAQSGQQLTLRFKTRRVAPPPMIIAMPGGNGMEEVPAKKLKFGESCTVYDECVAGLCSREAQPSGFCTKTCDHNADCPSGFDCKEGFGFAGKACLPHSK